MPPEEEAPIGDAPTLDSKPDSMPESSGPGADEIAETKKELEAVPLVPKPVSDPAGDQVRDRLGLIRFVAWVTATVKSFEARLARLEAQASPAPASPPKPVPAPLPAPGPVCPSCGGDRPLACGGTTCRHCGTPLS